MTTPKWKKITRESIALLLSLAMICSFVVMPQARAQAPENSGYEQEEPVDGTGEENGEENTPEDTDPEGETEETDDPSEEIDGEGALQELGPASMELLGVDRSGAPGWGSKVDVNSTNFSSLVSSSSVVSLTENITVNSAVARSGNLTIFGNGYTITFGTNGRINLSGSGALRVYDLNITASTANPSTSNNGAGVFCVNNPLSGSNLWTADFYSVTFTGAALVGNSATDSFSLPRGYFSDVTFHEENTLVASNHRAENAVVFARNVTIEGSFTMSVSSSIETADGARVGYYFKSPGTSSPASEYSVGARGSHPAYGTFRVADNADVRITRTPNARALTGTNVYIDYLRSVIYGYEKHIFGENSVFYAKANTNRNTYEDMNSDYNGNSANYRSAIIRSEAATEFSVGKGAQVTLETDEDSLGSGTYGYTAILLRRASPRLTFLVDKEATLDVTAPGNFTGTGLGSRAKAPIMIMGTGSTITNIYGTMNINSQNANGWYYAYNANRSSGVDTFTIDGGAVNITANGIEGDRPSPLPSEYAAFEHYNDNTFTLDIKNRGVMQINVTGWRAMSFAGTGHSGMATTKTINIDGSGSQLLVNPDGPNGIPTGYVQFTIAAEGIITFNLNVTNGGEMYARNTQDSSIYTVGRANYNVIGSGSKLKLIKTGTNSTGANKYSLYGAIFHDTQGPLNINVKDGGYMWVESTYGSRATICAQTHLSGQSNITVDGSDSWLYVINRNDGLLHYLFAERYIEDSALYPLGAIAFAANTSGNVTVRNGGNLYAESHNPISPTIALGAYASTTPTGVFTADGPGEIDIRNDGLIKNNSNTIDIRGIALRGRNNYAVVYYNFSDLGRGYLSRAKDEAPTLTVKNSEITVYERNGGFDKKTFDDWGNEHIIRHWKSTNFTAMNVGTTSNVKNSDGTPGANGTAVSSGSTATNTDFTLNDYGRIYIRGVSSGKRVSTASEAGQNGADVKAGDVITYSITYANYKDEAADLVITDTLPAGLAYISHTGVATVTSDQKTVTWEIANVGTGVSGEVTLTARVTAAAVDTVTNKATLYWSFAGGSTGKQEPSVTNPVLPPPAQSSKYVSDDSAGAGGEPVHLGDEITYEIKYINNTGSASNVTITDALHSSLAYISSTGGGSHNDGVVTWTISNVPAGGSGTVSVTVRVTDVTESKIVNRASLVWAANPGGEPETPEVETPIGASKYVASDSAAGKDGAPVKSEDIITYEIKYVNNTGTDNAQVVITDALPEGLTYVDSSPSATYNAGTKTLTWKITGVEKDASGTVSFRAKVAANLSGIYQIVNRADLEWRTPGGTTMPDEAETSNPATNPVSSRKYVDPGSAAGAGGAVVRVGDKITYVIEYVNSTGSAATLTITDILKNTGLAFVSATDGGNHDPATETVTWSDIAVPINGTGAVTVTVRVTDVAKGEVTNTASLRWTKDGGGAPETENPEVTNPLGSRKYVSSETGKDGAPVQVGDIITYTITYLNTTGKEARVVILDYMPKGLEYISSDDGKGNEGMYYGGTRPWIEFEFLAIEPGEGGAVTFTYRVTESVDTSILNQGLITWRPKGDIDIPEPERPEVTNPVKSSKYVSLDSAAGVRGAPVRLGDEITYEIKYINITGAAASATIRDVLPEGVTYVSSTGGGSFNGTDTVSWSIPTLAPSGSGIVTVTVRVTDVSAVDEIVNMAAITWSSDEDNPENPAVTNPIGASKYVASDSADGKDGAPVKSGDIITYEIKYVNNTGTDNATVEITDVLAPGLTYVGGSSTAVYEVAAKKLVWTITGVAKGASGTISFRAEVDADLTGISQIVNRADLVWKTSVGDTIPDEAETSNPATNPISSRKYVAPGSAAGADGALVRVGDEITYVIEYVNSTDSAATLTITDVLKDTGLAFVSATGGGSHDPLTETVTWGDISVPVNGAGAVAVTVRVTAVTGKDVTNTAVLSWATGSGEPETENPEVTNPLGSTKYVSSEIGKDGAPLMVGDEVTYTITYVNNTGKEATLLIVDRVPVGLAYISSDNGQGGSGNYNVTNSWVEFNLGMIEPGEFGAVTVTFKVTESVGTSVYNRGSINWHPNGGGQEGETPEVTNPVCSSKYVSLNSEAGVSGAPVRLGEEITYEIKYINNTGVVSDVTITDTLPTGVTYVSSTGGGSLSGSTVTWDISNVPAGGSGTVRVTVRVTDVRTVDKIVNAATVTWSSDPGNPETPKVTNPVGASKYVASDTGKDGAPVRENDLINYVIKYVNNTGTGNATVVITDVLPQGLTYVDGTATSDGIYDGGSRTLTWTITGIDAGGSGMVSFIAKVGDLAGIAMIVNQADLAWQDGAGGEIEDEDTNPAENIVSSTKYVSPDSAAGVDGAIVRVGDVITYVIDYVNTNGAVAGVVITDTLPAGLKYLSHTGTGTYSSVSNTVTWNISNVPVGGHGTVTVTAEVTEDAGAAIKNAANLAWSWEGGTPGTDTENPEVTNPVGTSKYIHSTSQAGADGTPVTVGDLITYEIKYVNNADVARNLAIADELPTGLAYVSHAIVDGSAGTGLDANFISGTNTVTMIAASVPAGGSGALQIIVQVTEAAVGIAKIVNKAKLAWANGTGEPEEPEVEVPVGSIKYIEDGTGAGGAVVRLGDKLTYTISYRNNTGSAATLTITDVLKDTGLAFVSATDGGNHDPATETVTWSDIAVPINGTGAVTVTVRVTAVTGKDVKNAAVLSWATGGDEPETEKPSVTNPLGSTKYVSSEAGKDGKPLMVGDEVTYTITYVNNTGKYANLTIYDYVPEGLAYIRSDNGQGDSGIYNVGDNRIVFEFIWIDAGVTGEVTVTFKVTESVGTSVYNKGEVTWFPGGGDSETETPEVTNPVGSLKYVSLDSEAGANGAPVRLGDEITYAIKYTNNTGVASHVTITDELPGSVTYVSSTGGGSLSGSTVTWVISNVPAGASGTVTVTVRVTDVSVVNEIINAATVTWSNDPGNPEEPKVTNPVGASKYVTGDTGANGAPVREGDEITYVIKYVNNTGTNNATVVITDVLAPGLTYKADTATNGGTHDDGTLTWTITGIDAGESGTVSFTAKVGDLTGITKIVNQADLVWQDGGGAEIPEEEEETNPTENVVGSTKYVIGDTGASGAPVRLGDEITYEIEYINNTGVLSDVTITDTLPGSVTYVSSTSGGVIGGNTVTWKISNVPAGGSGTVTVTVRVTDVSKDKEIVNAATVTWSNDPGNPETPEVTNPIGASKYVTGSTGANGAPVREGDEITYVIKYVNNTGTDDATVVITDVLAPGLTYKADTATNGGTHDDGTLTWTITGIDAGESGTVSFTAKVGNLTGITEIVNQAKLVWQDGGGQEIPGEDEETNPTENVVGSTKYVIGDTGASGAPVRLGDEITYEIQYVNNTGVASTATIVDVLPASVTYVSSTGGSFNGVNTVTWSIPAVADGGSGTVTVTVRVTDVSRVDEIVNTATVTWSSDPGNPETPKVTNPVGASKYVSGDSVAGRNGAPVSEGDEITYEIKYVNNIGTDDATVVITDVLSTALTYVDGTATDGGTHDGGILTWTITGIAAGGSGTVRFTAKVGSLAGIAMIVNQADLAWQDGAGGEIEDEDTNPAENIVSSAKYVSPDSAAGVDGAIVRVGDVITYVIDYVNTNGEVADVVITDTLPAGLKYLSHTGTGTYSSAVKTVTWNVFGVPVNGFGTVTVTAEVTEDAGAAITNAAKLAWSWGDDKDPKKGTENPEVTNPVGTSKYVHSSSQAGLGGMPITVGDEITYEIKYVNNADVARNLAIADELPTGLDYVSHAIVDGSAGTGLVANFNAGANTVTMIATSVPAGGSGALLVTVQVTEAAVGIPKIVNKANLVWANGTDEPEDPEVEVPVGSVKYIVEDGTGAGGAVVHLGDELTYTITYRNNTDGVANVTITDVLPTGVEYVSSTDRGVHYAGTVAWVINGVAAGADGAVTVTVKVTEKAGAEIRNTATVIWTGKDGPLTPEEPEVTNPVGSYKYVSEDSAAGVGGTPIRLGDEVTYEIKYINNTGVESDVTITDVLPDTLQYVRHTGDAVVNGNTVTWSISDVAPGGSGVVSVTAVVVEIASGHPITNKATVTWSEAPDGAAPEKPEVTNPVGSSKFIDTNSPGAGGAGVFDDDEITYRILYVNNTGKTADVIITDTLPEGLVDPKDYDGGTYYADTRTIKWEIKDVPAGASGQVHFTATVSIEGEDQIAVIVNRAKLEWYANDEPEPEDVEASNPTVNAVRSTKRVSENSMAGVDGAAVYVGDLITYELHYFNTTGENSDLTITDTLGDGLEFVSATGGGVPTDDTVVWNIPDVGAGKSGIVSITVRVTEAAGNEVTNSAAFVWAAGGPSDTEEDTVTNPMGSRKRVESVNGEAIGPVTTISIGDTITYEIKYINHSDEPANVTITDWLSTGLTYLDHSYKTAGTYYVVSNRVVWTFSNVAPGDGGTVTVTVRVNDRIGANAVNSANVVWSNGTVEEPEVELPVGSSKYIAAGSPGEKGALVHIGDEITYEIRYINNTGAAATLKIEDALDDGLAYVSHTNSAHVSGAETGGIVTWTGTVPAGATGVVTVKVRVTKEVGAAITNAAKLTWTPVGGGGTPKEEEPEITNPVGATKFIDDGNGENGAKVSLGDEITYVIWYANQTGGQADLTITDELEDGLAYVGSTGGSYNPEARTVTWTINDIPADGTGSVTITVRVTDEAVGYISNGANLVWTKDEGGEPIPEEPPVVINPISSVKYVSGASAAGVGGAPVKVGDVITYTLQYVNSYDVIAFLDITDTLGTGLRYVSSSPQATAVAGNEITWKGLVVNPGATGYVEITAVVTAEAIAEGIVTNSVRFAWSGSDGQKLPSEDSDVTNPLKTSKALLLVNGEAKEVDTYISVGDTLTYAIAYANLTGKKADVTITDDLPEGLTYVSSSPDGTEADGTVTWLIKDVADGEVGSVTVTVLVTDGIKPGTSGVIVNTATVKWSTQEEPENPGTEDPIRTYTITYNANGGTGGAIVSDVPAGSTHTVYTQTQANVARASYDFTGWSTTPTGAVVYRAGDTCKVTGNITLYAQWTYSGGGGPIPPTYYSVTYHANGGTGSHSDGSLSGGNSYTVRTQAATGITHAGKTFDGWNTKADGTGTSYAPGDSITISGSVTLYAQWKGAEPEKVYYTVTYHANGGVGSYADAGIEAGTEYRVLANTSVGISRSEYTFLRWNTMQDGTGKDYAVTEKIVLEGDITLYAQWLMNSPGGGGKTNPTIDIEEELPPLATFTTDHFAYIIGYVDGLVRPENNILRSEVTTVFFRLLNEPVRYDYWGTENEYHDVSLEMWCNNSISVMTNLGVITGYPNGDFGPSDNITRAELAAIAARFARLNGYVPTLDRAFSDVSGHWAESYIEYAAGLGWLKGYTDGTFRPDAHITRSEFIAIVNRMLERTPETTEDLLPGMTVWPDNANPAAWYYLDVQEATNSHFYALKPTFTEAGYHYETWTKFRLSPNWSALEKPTSEPYDLIIPTE